MPRCAARSSDAFVYAPSAIATPTVAKKPKLMSPVCTGCVKVTWPSIRRHRSSPSRLIAASAACKNAVRVRKSHPLAASCGKSRIGSVPALVPPATITAAMQPTSPTSRINVSAVSGSGKGSRWIHQNVTRPNTKYTVAAETNASDRRCPGP